MISIENFNITSGISNEFRGYSQYRYRLATRTRNFNPPLWKPTQKKIETEWRNLWIQGAQRGILAAKRNIIAAFFVQFVIALLLLSYYFLPSSKAFFIQIKEWKQQGGLTLCFLMMGGAVAILVEAIRIATNQKGRLQKINFYNFIFNFLIYGFWGVCTQLFINFQSFLFDSTLGFTNVLLKTLFDRCLWATLAAIPYQIILHLWRAEGYSFVKTIQKLRNFKTLLGETYLPLLITNQCFWIPMNLLIYCFPNPLQFPTVVLAIALWVLLLNTILKK